MSPRPRTVPPSPPVTREQSPGPAVRALLLIALAAATVAAFAGTMHNGWVLYDDPLYVVRNPRVNIGWNWAGALAFLHTPHGANWHPLTSWSHMLDVQLFGLDPGAHHAVSLAFHALNALLLVIVLRSLTGAWWRSLIVGALFALHPLRVESVAWVSERKDVLSGFFFVLALAAYGGWARRPTRAHYALLAAIVALGLMAKPMLVSLPFVLLLLDLWPLGRLASWRPKPTGPDAIVEHPGASPLPLRSFTDLVREKWLLFALSVASAILTLVFQRKGGALASTAPIDLMRRASNALASYGWYLEKTFWPRGLAPFYPLEATRPLGAPAVRALIAAAALALVTWLLGRQRARRPWLAVGWLWFLGMLVPVIGLVQVGLQAYADRYTYLPSIGLAIAVVWGVGEWVARRPALRAAAAGVSLVALTALGIASSRQVALWRDTRTLFTHDVAVAGDNAVAEQCLADVSEMNSRIGEAIEHRRRAVALSPGLMNAHLSLGILLAKSGRLAEADSQFRAAYRLSPDNADVLCSLGMMARAAGDTAVARRWLEHALLVDPRHSQALSQLGALQVEAGDESAGLATLRRAVSLDPENSQPHLDLALALIRLRSREPEAADQLREAVRCEPHRLDAVNLLAWVLATSPDPAARNAAEAVRAAERAVALSGGRDANVLDTRAAALAAAGDYDEALRAVRAAISLAAKSRAESLVTEMRARAQAYARHTPFVRRAGAATP